MRALDLAIPAVDLTRNEIASMKKLLHPTLLLVTLALTSPFAAVTFAAEKTEAKEEKKDAPKGSIRPAGDLTPAQMAVLAKISFSDALKAALRAAPGTVVKAELEVEDGNLQFSFEIVGADKKTTEVEVDAGNGKILDVDKEEKEEDDEKPAKKD